MGFLVVRFPVGREGEEEMEWRRVLSPRRDFVFRSWTMNERLHTISPFFRLEESAARNKRIS